LYSAVLLVSIRLEDCQPLTAWVKVTLRLTVSQSVSLGVKPHLGLMSRYLLLFDSYGLVLWGALSDERTAYLGHPRCLKNNPSATTTEKTHLPNIVAKEYLPNDCLATVAVLR
jgi:hypothetical protein